MTHPLFPTFLSRGEGDLVVGVVALVVGGASLPSSPHSPTPNLQPEVTLPLVLGEEILSTALPLGTFSDGLDDELCLRLKEILLRIMVAGFWGVVEMSSGYPLCMLKGMIF